MPLMLMKIISEIARDTIRKSRSEWSGIPESPCESPRVPARASLDGGYHGQKRGGGLPSPWGSYHSVRINGWKRTSRVSNAN
eukprot:1327683-Amorphochlora_amoeboformis.AAC.2